MSEVWSTVIVASVSIVSIVITQFLSSRGSMGQMVLQTRFSFFQEGYKDNIVVWYSLNEIRDGKEVITNSRKIQEIVDERPDNLAVQFLVKWTELRLELNTVDNKKECKQQKHYTMLQTQTFDSTLRNISHRF